MAPPQDDTNKTAATPSLLHRRALASRSEARRRPATRVSAIDSSVELLKSEDTRLWRAMFAVADRNKDFADILKRENEHYDSAVADELKSIEPSLSLARRRIIARMLRLMMDGLALELIYENPDSLKIVAIRNEITKMVKSMLSRR